jgi:hypothetical protein
MGVAKAGTQRLKIRDFNACILHDRHISRVAGAVNNRKCG